MKNKEVFDVFKLKTNEYALSLGLAVAPRVRFLNKAQTQQAKTEAQMPEEQLEEEELRSFRAQLKGTARREEDQNSETGSSSDDEESDSEEPLEPVRKPSQESGSEEEDDDLRDLDLLTVKRKDVFNIQGDGESAEEAETGKQAPKKNVAKDSKFKEAKKVLKRKFQVNTKVTFNEGGEAVQLWPPVQRLATAQEDDEDEEEVSGINVEKAKERLKREDQEFDKQEYRRKVKAKHRETRLKAKAARREARKKSGRKSDNDEEEGEEEVVAYLDTNSEDEFDPSMLPDPDKLYSKDDAEEEEQEEEEDRRASKRQYSSPSSDEDEQDLAAGNRKKAKQQDEEHSALDTGLSLAEDEELVLHLLGGSR